MSSLVKKSPLLNGLFCLFAILTVLGILTGSANAEETKSLEENVPSRTVLTANDPPQSFRALSYHDVRDDLWTSSEIQPDSTVVLTKNLIEQFTWLKTNGYHPVSLQEIIDARAGRTKLPDQAVLLVFDDGYKSMYTKVFPLLKLFNFSAVIGIVGKWIETPLGEKVQYSGKLIPRDEFVSWDEIRTMVESGLVEVASHSYDLHEGMVANPQGNLLAPATTRIHNLKTSTYESDLEHFARVKSDLERNSDLIESELGKRGLKHKRPRAMVWPYGRYTQDAVNIAEQAGMPVTMSLDDGPNTPADSLSRINRMLVSFDATLPAFMHLLRLPSRYTRETPIERVIHLDLDYIYDPDPLQQEANLSNLLDRMKRLRPTTVYLQAFADPDGDGVADAVYFPNRHLPMRADLFSRVAWQLYSRVGVRVYAWMPVMAFKLPDSDPAAARLVRVMPNAPVPASLNRYHRLSIFDPLVRKTIVEIYEDLGKSAIFDGVLFHDDATLSDYEDANPAALEYYRKHWQLPDSIAEIRSSPEMMRRWTDNKTDFINAFTVTLADKLREYQPALFTARNIYAQPVLNPVSEEWFAQNYPKFLSTYDFTAIMAMPYMEGAADPNKWLNQLREKVQSIPGALDKTVFELQSLDWNTNQPIPSKTLAEQLRQLHLKGVRNFGYYPDDFHMNQPEEVVIKPVISVEDKLTESQR